MIRIEGRSKQQAAYEILLEAQRQFFETVEPYEGGFSLQNFIGSETLKGYHINVRNKGRRLGVHLWGPSISDANENTWVLSLATMTEKGGMPAGLLAIDGSSTFLLHDGRVHSGDGRGRPFFADSSIEVDTKRYFLIADTISKDLFPRIVEYHESRLDLYLGSSDFKKAEVRGGFSGFDPGRQRGGRRSAVVFDAVHSPIAEALKKELIFRKYKQISCDMRVDLFVKKDEKRILFEIKPYAFLNDLILACGQLAIYNMAAQADCKILVTERFNRLNPFVQAFMKKEGISTLFYKKHGTTFSFPDLDRLAI